MDFNHDIEDISTSTGDQPTLGGNRVFSEINSIIKENFIIGGDLATNGTNPYQRGTSGAASDTSYMADRFSAVDNVAFTTEPTWAQTADGLTITSNEATTHSGYILTNHKLEGYEVTRLFSLADYFVLHGILKSSLAGKIYIAIRSSGFDATYVFPVTVTAGGSTPFSETIPVPSIGTFGVGTNLGMDVYICRSQNDAAAHTATYNIWQAGGYLSGSDQLDIHATNGATISIDKMKIEPGSIATPFWTPDYGSELRRCQRYYQQNDITWTSTKSGVTVQYVTVPHEEVMRISPAYTTSSFNDVDSGGLTISSINGDTSGITAITMSAGETAGRRYSVTVKRDSEL